MPASVEKNCLLISSEEKRNGARWLALVVTETMCSQINRPGVAGWSDSALSPQPTVADILSVGWWATAATW